MTRVNSAIPPADLCDQHLIAEYREISRISSGAWKAHERGEKPADMPPTFRLGLGHVRFFYPLGRFCARRYAALVSEMRHRGFTVNHPAYRPHPPGWNRDHQPTEAELEALRRRLADRMPAGARWTRPQLT